MEFIKNVFSQKYFVYWADDQISQVSEAGDVNGDGLMEFIKSVFSQKYFVYWAEFFVLVAIAVFFMYIAYSLNLFKKD